MTQESPFCGKCGTYTRVVEGRKNRVCPKCHPEKLPQKRTFRDYLDRTGMPCRDRGKCRPERCKVAFECEEVRKH